MLVLYSVNGVGRAIDGGCPCSPLRYRSGMGGADCVADTAALTGTPGTDAGAHDVDGVADFALGGLPVKEREPEEYQPVGDWRLKLDYDSGMAVPDRREIRRRLKRAGYRAVSINWRKSPSGVGRHVVIQLMPRPGSALEMVALQAILGSDPYREASNLQRAKNLADVPEWWRERWNVLYKRG